MKRLFFILIFIFAYNFVSYGNEMQYAEDNGAYWYLKVFEFEPEFSISERNKVYEITNIEAYNELSIKTRKQLEYALTTDFMQCLKAANTAQYCWFINEPSNADILNNNFPLEKIKNGYKFVNALGWSAIAMNKDKAGINLWLSMMKMSEKAAIMQNISTAQILGLSLQKNILSSISNYLANGKNEEAKTAILNFLIKMPDNVYNLKDIMSTQYKYVVLKLNQLERNNEALAKFFGSDISPRFEEIQECHRRLNLISDALTTYQMTHKDYFENEVPKIISTLLNSKILLDGINYDCPLDKKRSIKWNDEPNENGIYGFQLSCNCEVEFPAPKHPAPDSPSMVKARAYRNTMFETHKYQVESYWDKIMEFDFDSNPSQLELQNLFSIQKPEYRENILILHLNVGLTSLKSSLDEIENRKKRIIAKYVKDESESEQMPEDSQESETSESNN